MKKVAIVGYSETRELAPLQDDSFEIWGINDLYKHIDKYDRWFQIHTAEETQRTHDISPDSRDSWEAQKAKLKEMVCPVYMQDKHPEIPSSVKYPLEEILKAYESYFIDPQHAHYFTNTVSWMIALAIYEGFEEIHLYGVNMAVGTEFTEQRPSCEFWLGVAVGKGIKIHIPPQSDLLKTRFLYGFEDERKHAFEEKIDLSLHSIEEKRAQAETQERSWRDHQQFYAGAKQGVQELKQTWQ